MVDKDRIVSDRKSVQFLLQTGLALAICLMVAGILIKVFSDQLDAPRVMLFKLMSVDLALGDRLMALGILVLAATPAFRVIALLVLWSREGDWKFVAVAAVVMVTLAMAVLLGGG